MSETKDKQQTLDKEQIEFNLQQHSGLTKELSIQERLNASIIPSSSSTDTMYRVLAAGKSGLGELPERLEKLSKGKKEVTLIRNGQAREITQTTARGQDTIIVSNIEYLLEGRQNSPARKILVYVLSQILQQALANNNIIRDGVIISYQGLVDVGLYSDKKAAYRGLIRAFDLLSTIKIKGYVKHGKNKIEQVKASVLFYDMESTGKGSVILKINDTLNWDYLVQQYAILPNEYYKLPPSAADLFLYIFNQARVNIEHIAANGGKFNISFKAIHNFLGLPSIEAATNPTTQIKRPIESAIEAIEDNTQNTLYIEIMTPTDYNSIVEYLEQGYISIVLNPDYTKEYKDKVTKWEKAKQEALKRRQRNIDIAQQKAIQKKLEAAADTLEPPANDTKP